MKKLTELEWYGLLRIAKLKVKHNPQLRLGQSIFNTLTVVRNDLADIVRATEYDPFYNDKVIVKLHDYITKPNKNEHSEDE